MGKVLGVVGSARMGGNTDLLVQAILEGAKKQGQQTEIIYLSDLHFKGCVGCEACKKSMHCVLRDDMQAVYSKLDAAQGWVLGSPTYFYNVSSLMKMFMDRLYVYEVFDKQDRSVWLSPAEVFGAKYAVSVAVCEQQDEADMGFASEAMRMTLQAVGVRSVESLKVLNLFDRGKVAYCKELLQKAEKAGEKLGRTMILADALRENAIERNWHTEE